MIAENIMTDMAETLGIPAVKVCILKHVLLCSKYSVRPITSDLSIGAGL